MGKQMALVLAATVAVSATVCSSGSSSTATTTAAPAETAGASGAYVAGTYTGEDSGFGGTVSVTITTDGSSITDVEAVGNDETETIGGAALADLAQQILDAQSAEIDGVSGATITSGAVKEAAQAAIEAAKSGEDTAASAEGGEITYTAGTYTGTGSGYNGDVVLDVTFGDDAITDIQVNTSGETAHVSDIAYDIMFADAIEANGSGIDSVSGATFTSRAIKEAFRVL